jgi:hypothetical protein
VTAAQRTEEPNTICKIIRKKWKCFVTSNIVMVERGRKRGLVYFATNRPPEGGRFVIAVGLIISSYAFSAARTRSGVNGM